LRYEAGMRIVSLLPSSTEIVCALGAGDELVGVSHECDFPAFVVRLPVLTSARIPTDASSAAIDASVRAVVRDALSIYRIDEEALGRARPDVIVTQDLCEVCAVSLEDVRRAVARLAQQREVTIVSLRPTMLDDILEDIARVGAAIGRARAAQRLRQELNGRMDSVAARAGAVARLRVASVEWLEPLMLGGTWMPELIERAGATPVGVAAGAPAPTVSARDLEAARPDVVVIKPCGFTLERSLREKDTIQRMILDRLPASCRVYVADGNAFFNRPGPRIVESLEIMAACVHPDVFPEFAARHAASIRRLR
jgi:iron complex transport system substrate-binding protein